MNLVVRVVAREYKVAFQISRVHVRVYTYVLRSVVDGQVLCWGAEGS